MQDLVLTTAASVDGEVESILGIVYASESMGTGLLTDLSGSVADLFGIPGSGYERALQAAIRYALDTLELEAASRGANTVLGLRIDHEWMSETHLVVVSVTGTAVRMKWRNNLHPESAASDRLSSEHMTRDLQRLAMLREARAGRLPLTDAVLIKLRWIRSIELLPYVIREIGAPRPGLGTTPSYALPAQPGAGTAYLLSLPPALVSEHLHAAITSAPAERVRPLVEMVHYLRLVDLSACATMLSSDSLELRKRALAILIGEARSYVASDAMTLETLVSTLAASFPPRGIRASSEGADDQHWTCPCGGGSAAEYCNTCGLDLRGFRAGEPRPEALVQLLTDRLTVLRHRWPEGARADAPT